MVVALELLFGSCLKLKLNVVQLNNKLDRKRMCDNHFYYVFSFVLFFKGRVYDSLLFYFLLSVGLWQNTLALPQKMLQQNEISVKTLQLQLVPSRPHRSLPSLSNTRAIRTARAMPVEPLLNLGDRQTPWMTTLTASDGQASRQDWGPQSGRNRPARYPDSRRHFSSKIVLRWCSSCSSLLLSLSVAMAFLVD